MNRAAAFLLAAAATVCGCSDPFLREGTWHPLGVNQANLRDMVADPRDLERGVDEPGTNGRLAVAAVGRLRSGQVKALPDTGISKIGVGGSAAAAPLAAAGQGAN